MSEPTKKRDPERGKHWRDYWPLAALILISAAVATALTRTGDMLAWMHYFMGWFLCSFAMLKIFDLKGFANGFGMYDLLAHRLRPYAYIYPFIELALGLGYLSFAAPRIVYIATMAVMLFSATGVLLALRRGLDIYCPCMGSILKVPLSTVTLTEDIGMLAMAAFMLAYM